MSRIKNYVTEQFSHPKGFGGKIVTFIMNMMNKAMYRAVADSIPDNGNILDLGFGNGYTLQMLLKRSSASFFGIEISADMIKAATERNKKAIRDGRLRLTEGSAENITFVEDLDCIYTINTVYFWPDLNAGLRHIYSKLNEGGVFLNLFYTKDVIERLNYQEYGYRAYEPEELKKAAEAAGFAAEIIPIKKNRSYIVKAVKRTDV